MKKFLRAKSFLLIFISLLFLLPSCTSYNKVHNLYAKAILKDGYWGDWENTYYFSLDEYMYKVKTYQNEETLDIIIYDKNEHPSNYNLKITIIKKTGNPHDNDWYAYKGRISIGKYNSLNQHATDEFGKTYNCEIRCDKSMKKAIAKKGLLGIINVHYRGIGQGFAFQ